MLTLINELKKIGVKKIISCPGGRNQPLLEIFETSKDFSVETFFDERSASFYALGLATKGEPVVVVTTSGSAVAECLPAVIEAKYQGSLPLIVLSADRPYELRYSGAPQTIPQQNIFRDFALSVYDLKTAKDEEKMSLEGIKFPAHINICIKEPNPLVKKESLLKFDQVVIISELKKTDYKRVKELLKDYEGFVILEALSNFNESDFLKASVVRLSDLFFEKVNLSTFKKVVRIGAVPVLKVWREIDDHESYYLTGYLPGSIKSQEISFLKLKEILENLLKEDDFSSIKKINEDINERVKEAKTKFSYSEVSLISDLIDKVSDKALMFVGNSLPIREVQHANLNRNIRFIGQRGVNGIDGSISLALGAMSEAEEAWILLGDLTCLYDIQGLWALRSTSIKKLRIVVINNSGGQIFKKIFNKDYMLNSHDMSFEFLAKFWKLDYFNDTEDLGINESRRALIEIKPNAEHSKNFWETL